MSISLYRWLSWKAKLIARNNKPPNWKRVWVQSRRNSKVIRSELRASYVKPKKRYFAIFHYCSAREYWRGKYLCTIDLLFDWFGLVCFANKNINCQLSYSWFQTSQTEGQWYSDTSPFSIPWLSYSLKILRKTWQLENRRYVKDVMWYQGSKVLIYSSLTYYGDTGVHHILDKAKKSFRYPEGSIS